MIPYTLRLKGFMCYREEQSLDFTGLHLTCLAGENGHGKSTLLDAITWALWGKARAHRDDELITLDNRIDEMWVDFEFGLGGQRYRVWRQRSKRGRGQSDLHFYIARESGEWQLLDEGGLVERQKQIIRTLRMEYDTFVNSAFVLQGKADSFTIKTPGERKQILADILGLGLYDIYEGRAKDQIQARREHGSRLQGEIMSIDRELANRAEYEARLMAARTVVTETLAAARQAEAAHAEASQIVAALQSQEAQLTSLNQRMARAGRDVKDLRVGLQTTQAQLAGFEATLARRDEIEAGWAALGTARDQDGAYNAGLRQHSQLQEQSNQVRREIDQARAEIQAEMRRLVDRSDDLAQKIAAAAQHAAFLEEAQASLAQMERQQQRRDQISVEQREVSAQAAALRGELDRLKAEGQAVREKMDLMTAAAAAACPLCGQDLTTEHRDRMLADLDAERNTLLERFHARQADLKTLGAQREALDAEDADLAAPLRARDARQRQAAQSEAAVAEGERAATAQAALTDQMARLEAQLTASDYALAAQDRLVELLAQIAALGYDAEAHARVRESLERLALYDGLYQRQLLPALEAVDSLRAQVQAMAAQLDRREAELAEDLVQRTELEAAVRDLPQRRRELGAARDAVDAATLAERRARQHEGAAMQQLDALAVLSERRRQCETELVGVSAEIAVFTELREAFGKRGLQAMIIESAIPEIEVEANQLLSRMTEGRMGLRLETQRENVTGGVRETLDIRVADELGEREYGMYSGGEAFRANLALRIAISKLLARRAGAQLQTLVIDEGFGTQDAQGRDLLVQAINSIQDDFELIIVITHIEELKDHFPSRIEVVKTAAGSHIFLA